MPCFSPIFISDKTPFGKPFHEFTRGNFVGCGKCLACVRRKRDDLACRLSREAVKRGSLEFVTLTYRPTCLPFMCSVEMINTDTGEVFSGGKPFLLQDSDLLDSLRYKYAKMPHGSKPIYFNDDLIDLSDFGEAVAYRYCFTPSLSRRDFRLWIKSARVAYEREHGAKLPDFSYCCVGEYGPKTCRPHYHVAFMGLEHSVVCELCKSWNDKFGFSYIESVKRINQDGSSGFLAASRYVGKYMSKGSCECPSVIDGYAEKPRKCASLGHSSDSMISNYHPNQCQDQETHICEAFQHNHQ